MPKTLDSRIRKQSSSSCAATAAHSGTLSRRFSVVTCTGGSVPFLVALSVPAEQCQLLVTKPAQSWSYRMHRLRCEDGTITDQSQTVLPVAMPVWGQQQRYAWYSNGDCYSCRAVGEGTLHDAAFLNA